MSMNPVQRRTLGALERTRGAPFPGGYVEGLRADLEARLAAALPQGGLRISKAKLNALDRCEGSFAAELAGERGPFSYSFKTAVGAIVHRAVQADVAGERTMDARSLVDHALRRQLLDTELPEHWAGLEEIERHEILAESTRELAMFREMMPVLDRRAQPLSELSLQVRLLDDRVILTGRPDLVLGRPPAVALDIKTGDPRPEHAEDGRYYALLLTLMLRRPASLVATAYLDSLEIQHEEVEPRTLERAADRVVAAARAAHALSNGRAPVLRPGPYCSWCPRAETCPANA